MKERILSVLRMRLMRVCSALCDMLRGERAARQGQLDLPCPRNTCTDDVGKPAQQQAQQRSAPKRACLRLDAHDIVIVHPQPQDRLAQPPPLLLALLLLLLLLLLRSPAAQKLVLIVQ